MVKSFLVNGSAASDDVIDRSGFESGNGSSKSVNDSVWIETVWQQEHSYVV